MSPSARFNEILPTLKDLDLKAYCTLSGFGFNRKDAYHESLVMLFDLCSNRHDPDNWRNYILTCLKNKQLDQLKKSSNKISKNSDSYDSDWMLDDAVDNEELSSSDFYKMLELNGLEGDRLKLIYMRMYLGNSLIELSKHFDVPVGTIKSRISRAIAKMRDFREDIN